MEFIEKKLMLSLDIYKLLTSLCVKNLENQKITSKYLALFVMHSFFIPSSFQTIFTIIQNNEEFMLQLLEKEENAEDFSPKKTQTKTGFEENQPQAQTKQVSIEHISKNSKERLKMIEALRNDFEEKSKKAFGIYIDFYNKVLITLKDNMKFSLPNNQDLINFFIGNCMNAILTRLSQPKHVNLIRKNLFSFLKKVCSIGQAGVNPNQELIFKLLIQELRTLDYVLIQIENDENKLVLTLENNKRELEEIAFQTIDMSDKSQTQSFVKKEAAIITKAKKPSSFFRGFKKDVKEKDSPKESLLKDEVVSPKSTEERKNIEMVEMRGKDTRKSILKSDLLRSAQKNVAGQLDFFSYMCNGRNYTWKAYLEKNISYYSLIRYLQAPIDFDMKANVCKLLTKLYIDQEPRRIQILPELCKVVNVANDTGSFY